MSTRTTTVRASQTTTKQDTQEQQEQKPSQDRCAHCKKFLPAVKAECRYCRQVFCMEHRHPETHSPTGCAEKARQQSRQEFQRDSGHILGAESHDRGSTHRPGWNLDASRQDLSQRLQERVRSLKETSGRAESSQGSTSGSGGSGPKKGKTSAKKSTKKPKTWGTGGSRLGGVPGSGSAGAGGGGSNAA